MRIAVLVLLHEYTEQQKTLIDNLSKDFDVYIHIDKKSALTIDTVAGNNIYVYKKYKVYWGHFNQIRATLFLFKMAYTNTKVIYDRFIFISGADIPIRTNSQIYQFFTDNPKEYLAYEELPCAGWGDNGGYDRIDFYRLRALNRGKVNQLVSFLNKVVNKVNDKGVIPFAKSIGIKRDRLGIKYYGGTNWMDLTYNCVGQLLDFTRNNQRFVNRFRFTRCADEIFFQTIICNYVSGVQLENKCLRYVDWSSGPEFPRTMRVDDYDKIRNSDCLFARKFNRDIDRVIIDKIYKDIGYIS